MRVKTEERRQAIMAKAYEVFREQGYDLASMSEIAKRVGGSKATLYSYFKTKEELFTEVMRVSPEVGEIYDGFSDPNLKIANREDLRALLERFGLAFMKLVLTPNLVAWRRNLISQGDRSDIGRISFESGPKQHFMLVADFLGRMMHEGHLRSADPWMAMTHFMGLLEAGLVLPRMIGILKTVPPDMIEHSVPRAVDVFLRGYAQGDAANAMHGALTKKAEAA